MKLKSNFHDYYDHAFPLDGEVFSRRSDGGPDRSEMLFMLHHLGFQVPTHGTVSDLYQNLIGSFESEEAFNKAKEYKYYQVVVYHDMKAHNGDGKELMHVTEAKEKFPDAYASQYIPCPKPRSWRYLSIGRRHFWMEFTSDDTWRSNAGDVNIKLFTQSESAQADRVHNITLRASSIQLPLFAIDFVGVHNRLLTAVDFNVAPGLKNTGLEEELEAQEVANLIMSWKSNA